jgi:hypothetical protein
MSSRGVLAPPCSMGESVAAAAGPASAGPVGRRALGRAGEPATPQRGQAPALPTASFLVKGGGRTSVRLWGPGFSPAASGAWPWPASRPIHSGGKPPHSDPSIRERRRQSPFVPRAPALLRAVLRERSVVPTWPPPPPAPSPGTGEGVRRADFIPASLGAWRGGSRALAQAGEPATPQRGQAPALLRAVLQELSGAPN